MYSYYRVSRPRRPAAKPRRCYREASREPLAPARLVTTLLCYLSRIIESEAAGVQASKNKVQAKVHVPRGVMYTRVPFSVRLFERFCYERRPAAVIKPRRQMREKKRRDVFFSAR